MLALILGFISFVGWGIGDVFGAISSRRIGGVRTSLYVSLAGLVLSIAFIPFAPGSINQYTPTLFFLNIFLALFAIAGNVSLNVGLRNSNAALVGTIAASFPALVILISVIFFDDQLSWLVGVLILVIFSGIILSSLPPKESALKIKSKGILLALTALFSWGIYFGFIRIVMDEVGWFYPQFISIIVSLFATYFIYIKTDKKNIKPLFSFAIIMTIIGGAFLLRTADFAFNASIKEGFAPISGPIGGAYPLLFVIISYIIFRDPISRVQKIGMMITLLGIITLSFFTFYL